MRPVAFIVAGLSCALATLGSAACAQVQPVDLAALLAPIDPAGPGCVTAVSIRGGAPTIVARGQADLEHAEPLSAGSIIETGSLAKQFTASAMILLVQDGKLSLDDDIHRYLPELADYGTPVTIRQLLNHTSGLREQWSLLALAGNPPGVQVHTQATILDLASRQKDLNFAPGAEYSYANTNYTLAAVIIERVSGQNLQAFTNQRLFQPLGMTNTRWREDFRTVIPGRASAYAADGKAFIANMPFTSVTGNGGLLTTVGDLLRWNAFLDKPSALPRGPEVVAALETPGRLNSGATSQYALGLQVSRVGGRRIVWHDGSTGGYKTWLGRYPAEGVSAVLMCNNGGINPVELGRKIADAALVAAGHGPPRSEPMPAEAPAIDPVAHQGLFLNRATGELLRFDVIGGQLMLRGWPRTLAPLGEDRFQGPGDDIVEFGRKSGSGGLILTRGGARQTYSRVQPAAPDLAALSAYIGTYYSPELDTRITVAWRGDALVMRQRFGVEWVLSPSFADGFTTPLRGTTAFVFQRAADGKVIGFGAWANGVRNLRFARQ